VLDHLGRIVWSRRPTTSELRGLSVYDLDGDKTLDIVVTAAVGSQMNTWIYNTAGVLRPGWPQLNGTSGYAYGVYNSNAAVHDLNKDGRGEIVVPSDVHYIAAYGPNGGQLPANVIYGTGKGWGKVGVWESLATELRGWGTCTAGDARAERYRTNFAHGASVIADVNGDGRFEVVVTGNVYDCAIGHPPGKYNGVYIFNADRSRFTGSGYDWRTVPVDTGAPLTEDYNVIENNVPNPAVADLDGDGKKEIVYASYDGRVHAFWLDKVKRGTWPYSVYSAAEGIPRFASEPVIADLDNDGRAEVIFTSWVKKGTNKTGKLHILNWLGTRLHEVALPLAFGADWNGALAAPTLANIDSDPDLEVVLNTAHSGFVAYDLPGTASARVLWRTGRGNFHRTGTAVPGPLPVVSIAATDAQAAEPGANPGVITLTRTGSTTAPLTVKLTLTGGATNGVDYRTLPTAITMPAGRVTLAVAITPLDDVVVEATEVVNVNIAASDAYRTGAPATAAVSILDND
ncbi:MAG: hypothetical protein HOP18_14225, partial [Deltaproteobacteria bacterium]|nr:hypothetical protein [Deltaproteobacteria bacterium]